MCGRMGRIAHHTAESGNVHFQWLSTVFCDFHKKERKSKRNAKKETGKKGKGWEKKIEEKEETFFSFPILELPTPRHIIPVPLFVAWVFLKDCL